MLKLREKLILGSKSPRRKELIGALGLCFETFTMDVEESYDPHMPVDEVAIYLSKKKNSAYRKSLTNEILITADTIVIQNQTILEKPKHASEAEQFLATMSGNDHKVITGVTISGSNEQYSFMSETKVTFKALKKEEIAYYVREYQPFDKAGAYGIQEWMGLIGITQIHGSYYNVMGIPTDMIYACLEKNFCQ